MADNSGTYAEQAAAGNITRFDSTPVFPQEILDYLVEEEIINQSDIDDAIAALRN